MAKKATKSKGTIAIEEVEEFIRVTGTDLLAQEEIPDECPRAFYNEVANKVLEKRIEIFRKKVAEA
jgi:hypothetical protein